MSEPPGESATDSLAPARASGRKQALQILGFLAGLALLAWAVSMSLSPENIGVWKRLREASARDTGLLVGLTLLSLALNGIIFWITLLPIKRLPVPELIGVNCVGTFLTLLPMKLSLVARTLIHRARHGCSWKELASWGLAFVVLTGGTLTIVGGMVVFALKRGLAPSTLCAAIAALLAVFVGGVMMLGKWARGRLWYAKWFHATDAIFRSPTAVVGHVALRVLDMTLFGLRFAVAAKITGVVLAGFQSFVLGSSYLFLNAAAPAGSLGFAEAGTAGVANLLGMDAGRIVSLALIVTACQGGISGLLAVPAWLWLRPRGGKLRTGA